MTTLRKLELVGGILIAAIGTYVGLTLIYLDYQTSQRHAEAFPITRAILLGFLIYMLPAFAIVFGSYLHAVKRKQLGQFLVISGSLVNVAIFLLLFIQVPVVPYGRIELFWLPVFSAGLVILTCIISVFVQRRSA